LETASFYRCCMYAVDWLVIGVTAERDVGGQMRGGGEGKEVAAVGAATNGR